MRRGGAIWVVGVPSSGKSTTAEGLIAALRIRGTPHLWLDSDDLRPFLTPAAGYDTAGRDAFYRAIAELATRAARGGATVVVSATAPARRYRNRLREALAREERPFVEVYLRADREVLEAQRDKKGLYAKARAGEIQTLPGLGAPFEAPEAPEVTLSTTRFRPPEVIGAVIDWIEKNQPELLSP